MPLAKFRADAFGVTVISLFVLFDVLAIPCIDQVAYLQVRILQQNFLQLGYFNGPWVTHILLVLVAIFWSLSEIARLSFLKGSLFSGITWQRNMCKLYILFNLGFSEPSIFLILVFLLRASLLKRELGALNQGWSKKAIGHVFLFCLPISIMQFIVVFVGPKLFDKEKGDGRANKTTL
ncbi:uncharacterized protein LOC135677459 [Musa acuminata AAA Group]|uniref:uncharacterized protein LOC135677459 n=1 Tax=Musa acuminata AAA Group TaxID=214697 RepID=UPI0031DC44BA